MPIEIANVQLSNSFDNWRNTTNDIIKSLKEQVVLREQLDLTSLSPFPELVGAASLDSVEVSAQPTPETPVIGGYKTGNTVIISPSSKITNFKPGQKVRIYGAKISSSNPGNLLPPNLTSVDKIGFSAELSGPTTFTYKIAQFDYTTGRISGCINEVDALPATNVNVDNFNDVNYIGVTFTRADPSYGILIYRSVGTPVNVPYSLVAVLGPKDLTDTSETWNDYYDYNYVSWSKKSPRNEFTTNSGLIHFPITPSVNARLGWADAEVSFVDTAVNRYRVSFVNDYNFESNMIVSHDDTSIIQTAIDNRFAAGGKSLELATKTYIVQGLTIPNNFAIIGNATKTTLKKLGWSSSTSPTGNKLLRSAETVNDFSITNVVLDGNMQNQYLISEAGDDKANYLIDVRGSVSRYENIKLINAIGGGINASDSNSISVISSFVIDSNLDDFYYYSPLDITASSDVLITSNIFRNFSGGIEASVVTSGSIVGNIIKNCGTGLVIYGSTNLISSPNILMGTAGEFLPTPDILNSEYDSVNIKLEPNNEYVSTDYVYQENGSNFNLTANRSELFHRIDKLQKDALTGVESLYGNEVLISGNRPLQTESGNDLANGQFSFSISQVNVDVLLSTYSYSSLRGPTNEGKNPIHIGLVYRSMLKEYVPTGNVNPVFTPFANNISKSVAANTLGVNSGTDTIKVTNNDAVNTFFNFNVGDQVYYNLAPTSTAIGGLTANTIYYVSFANNTDVALSSTYNGANIDLTEIRTAAETHNLDKTVYVVKLFDGATNISFGKRVRFLDHGGTPDLNGLIGTVVDFNLSSDICAIAYDPTINITSPGTVGRITVENSFVLAKGRNPIMSSLTNINNNASVVNVGRTTPVSPGQQTSDKSIPVVIASDQEPIPVSEQNKVVSEVALSLLGIPRSEVALGIFADVNTYDVNPSEWSSVPAEYTLNSSGDGWGIKHLPEEAGALIEAPKDKVAVLTSKRFFRYQPGRVSAATFGVKSTVSPSSNSTAFDLNPSIRKYGIFDKYDGYYWETRADGKNDNFSVVRRTQSLLRNNPVPFGDQTADHAVSGKAPSVYTEEPNASPTATKFLINNRFKIIETAFAAALPGGSVSTQVGGVDRTASDALNILSDVNKAKCKRDMDLATEAYILDLQYGGNAHSIVNATTYRIAAVVAPTVEDLVHRKLREAIALALDGISENTASDRVYNTGASTELAYWTLLAINNSTTRPNSGEINGALYGSRSAISTIFAIYSRYYAYIASEYTFNAENTGVVAVTYGSAANTLSQDEIKYRCYRDVTYILRGYGEDLEFGGDASTLYNAKRYYFNGLQIYSQTPGGAAGEILRHQFIKALLTTDTVPPIPTPGGNKTIQSLKVLFPNVFSSTAVVNKLNDLANKIISNFSTEYVGNIEYGRGANYGDLVVLRDGLIMTHAAVFDPTLLKATKNVVVKPNNLFKRTVAPSGSSGSTVVIDSATNVTRGMTVSGTGITPGTYITNISGTSLTLSNTAAVTPSQTIYFGNSTLETSQDEFVVGQYINFYGTDAGASSHGLTANRLYRVEKVRGSKGNIITVSDATTKNKLKVNITLQGNPASSAILSIAPSGNPDAVVLGPGMRIEGKGLPEGTSITQASGTDWIISSIPSNNLQNVEITKIAMISPDVDPLLPTPIHINPNVPFIFPTEYHVGKDPANLASFKKYNGLFPLMYAAEGLPATEASAIEKVGYIDTSIVEETQVIEQQIDTVNLIYNNWVKQNVDPKFYSVYEYRVPRSRFSTDQLNGATNSTVYSDVATAELGGRVFAGTPVLKDGAVLQTKSVWDIDFTKVTMLKVEFSWYGAVGALFLAYVPVGNGDARWVRVHHLRASNQLKISSLGNATLPITYLVYGGGSTSRLGIEDATNKGYTRSNHVVKYGASYYIDGGDRGTVRLYSHSTIENTEVFGSRYSLSGATVSSDANGAYIDISSVSNIPPDPRYFMKSKILTNSRADQNVEVIWTYEQTTPSVVKKLYISKGTLVSSTNLVAIANRPSVVFGLKAKQDILNSVGTGIRNRVQVYPTKLSTSSIAPTGVTTVPKVKLQLLKTPIFQPVVTTTGAFTLTQEYPITPANAELPTTSNYLDKDGTFIYGWFRANVGTVFGMLYKQSSKYYFNLLETYSGEIILKQNVAFLPDGRFSFNGASLSTISEDTIQKERLSSVFVSTQIQTPIPRTGTEVASFFSKEGADLFDLLNYFDYNKDYLSFPLTDKVESVYLTASSVQDATFAVGVPTTVAEVSSSLTWEEQ